MRARTPSTKPPPPQIKAAALRTFHQRLARWYATHGRHDLPWRLTDDPYKIWVSEVMLQQTQVATVRDKYYAPFLKTFPTVAALAAAPREKVLKAWEGLGYYRRAGHLHDAAKLIVKPSLRGGGADAAIQSSPSAHPGLLRRDAPRNDGIKVPGTIEALRALPGIGRNTAHAVMTFAHHAPVAILEANVKRVVARIFALETPKEDELWAGAEILLDAQHPFDHNQAMMDLGAMICTPKAPDCPHCPANSICKGQSDPEAYPQKKAKKQVPVRQRIILLLEDAAGRFHLESRADALLGGLYGFPQLPVTTDLRYAMREMHIAPEDWQSLGDVTQIYSHFRLEGEVRYGRLRRRMNSPGWYDLTEIADLPLSRVDHKVLALVAKPQPSPRNRSRSGKPALAS